MRVSDYHVCVFAVLFILLICPAVWRMVAQDWKCSVYYTAVFGG